MLKKLCLSLGILLGCLIAAEPIYRVVRRGSKGPYDSKEVRGEIRQIVAQMTERLGEPANAAVEEGPPEESEGARQDRIHMLHPFIGFESEFGVHQLEEDRIFFESTAPSLHRNVFVLGGSVAAMFGWTGGARLAQMLLDSGRIPSGGVRIRNYAKASFKQPQQLNMLAFLLIQGIHPDIVINIDGFNEVAQSNVNAKAGSNPLFPSAGQWAPMASASTLNRDTVDMFCKLRSLELKALGISDLVQRYPLVESSLLGELLTRRVRHLQAESVATQQRIVESVTGSTMTTRGAEFNAETESVIAEAVQAWMESSRCLQALCRRYGIQYLHVLQPTLHDPGSKPLTEEERKTGTASAEWMEAVHIGYPLLREGGAKLAQEGIAFLDLSRVFADVSETLYFDACHFNDAGNWILAENIANALLVQENQKRARRKESR